MVQRPFRLHRDLAKSSETGTPKDTKVPGVEGSKTMNLVYKRAIAIILLMSSLAAPVAAGPFEDAAAAYGKGDYATALQLFRPLADQGMARAQTILGVMYANGQGVPKSDTEATKWYQLALGVIYVTGLGVPKDTEKGLGWFRKAADQGYANAQTNLGTMYDRGDG